MLYEYYFQGKKPSKAQVLKQVSEGDKQNATLIEISWGENMLTLDKQLFNGKREAWYGYGWIKDISGDDIAKALNSKKENKTLNLWNT
jgi:hypothetical protein